MVRRKDRLTSDDQALWKRVAETAEQLRPRPSITVVAPDVPLPARPHKAIAPFRIGEKPGPRAKTVTPTADLRMEPALQMDRRSFDRLRKGRLRPEARLDLHGLSADEAHGRLNAFIAAAHNSDLRLVLIITGKGRNLPEETGIMPIRKGILRHSVPHWLAQGELRGRILQVAQAHDKHGGGGALYVYLRRRRAGH